MANAARNMLTPPEHPISLPRFLLSSYCYRFSFGVIHYFPLFYFIRHIVYVDHLILLFSHVSHILWFWWVIVSIFETGKLYELNILRLPEKWLCLIIFDNSSRVNDINKIHTNNLKFYNFIKFDDIWSLVKVQTVHLQFRPAQTHKHIYIKHYTVSNIIYGVHSIK